MTAGVHAGYAQSPLLKDSPSQHERYFTRQRAYPFERIPPGALQKARRQKEARWPARSGFAFGQAVGNGWTAVGPNNVNISIASSGRLTAIAVHPTIPTTIYAGGAQGGVWKTVNGGSSWTPLTDDQCSLAIGSIVIDQAVPNIVYVGTGELHNSGDSYYGCGVLRSTDGGTTWQQLGASVFDIPTATTGGVFISKIVIDRASAGTTNATTVFAATSRGVYRSTNSGVDWTPMNNGIPQGGGAIMSDMVADTTAPGTFYAALGHAAGQSVNGVYKTTNGGTSWSKLTTFPTASVGRINLAISQSSPNVLYAAVHNSTPNNHTLLGIFKTVDGGANWASTGQTGASCSNQCWYDMHLAVNPLGPDTVYFGGFSLYKSTNGGASFTNIGNAIHVDHHSFAFDPNDPRIIYAGSDGGIYRSADGGATWTTLNTDIAIHQFYGGFSLHPTIATRMMGGSQDNGTNEYNGTPSWLQILGGDGGFTAIDHVTGNTAWAEMQWGANGGPWRRDAASGGGFLLKRNGINTADEAEFIPPLVMDPVNPRVLYFGTTKLYRTRDNGETWNPISADLTGGTFTPYVEAIAVARNDTNVIYYGTDDGRIQATGNAGATWITGVGLPGRFVTDIAVDPTNASVAYATVSGFGTGHVYRTTDRGVSWINISSDLPDLPVNAIVIQPGAEIDIGTDLGVFRTSNEGASWVPFTGLPNVAVFDLAFNPVTQLLVAATHGRGAFKYTVPQVFVLRGDVTSDNTVSALDAQAVLSATVGLTLPGTWKPSAPNGDANCDGTAPSAQDAQLILAYVVGLPVGGACVGKFQ